VLKEVGVEEERIHVIPHGLLGENGLERIESGNEKRDNNKETIIQFFGTLKPYKGVDKLIEALSKIPKEEEVVLKISGRPRMDVETLKRKADELGISEKIDWDLRFVPEEEVPNIFREADVLVLPYRTIDASGVLTKALLFGTPVIASDIGGIDEFVTDGDEGFLVPSEDAEALASALRELIQDGDLRIRMGEQARRRADQIPSWGDIAQETENVYRNVRR
jgi:glycosyltransferase involved in cell wall biosynthesis